MGVVRDSESMNDTMESVQEHVRGLTFLTSARMGILMCPKPPLLRGVLIHARCTCHDSCTQSYVMEGRKSAFSCREYRNQHIMR